MAYRGEEDQAAALRENLLDLLRRSDVRQRMNEALLREATGEAKSTGVIRAYELVRSILAEAGDGGPSDAMDLSRVSDSRLRDLIAQCEKVRGGLDSPAGTPVSGTADSPSDAPEPGGLDSPADAPEPDTADSPADDPAPGAADKTQQPQEEYSG